MYVSTTKSTQSIPNGVWTPITCDGIWVDTGYDTKPLFSYDTPDRIVYPVGADHNAGAVFTATVNFAANGEGDREAVIQGVLNGSTIVLGKAQLPASVEPCSLSVSTVPWVLRPGDYVQLWVRQTSGIALDATNILFGMHSLVED